MEHCNNLEKFLNEQMLVIKRHINKHKYYTRESDVNKAMQDFIVKYGWIMRELYCDAACSKNKECEAYQHYLKHNREIDL